MQGVSWGVRFGVPFMFASSSCRRTMLIGDFPVELYRRFLVDLLLDFDFGTDTPFLTDLLRLLLAFRFRAERLFFEIDLFTFFCS